MKKSLILIVLMLVVCVAFVACAGLFTNEYTVTFDTDGGNAIQPVVIIDGAFEMPANPTKEGYTFAGWYYADGTQYKDGDFIQENTTLYARWTENAGNGGDASDSYGGCGGCGSNLGASEMLLIAGAIGVVLLVLGRKSKKEE